MAEITCRSLCNRSKCYYFKEINGYTKQARLLFSKVLGLHASTGMPLGEAFARCYNSRSYTNVNRMGEDQESFRDFCLQCLKNLSKLFVQNTVTKLNDKYSYNYLITGKMDGVISGASRSLNLSLSYKNAILTHQDIDFHFVNNYLYNVCKNVENDLIIMSVPTDSFLLIEQDDERYTIPRGYFTKLRKLKFKKRGPHCLECARTCGPNFVRNSDRLKELL